MTVRGPVPDAALGTTLPHEHLLLDLFRVYQPHRDLLMDDVALAVAELALFAKAGGGTLVEVTTPDLGRDPGGLVEIAQATGVNIVMGTGRYREPFYEGELWRLSTAELARQFVEEIEHGADGVRPGIIGELGTDADHLTPVEERVHRAAARAHLQTGLTITTHSLAHPVGLAQLDVFEEEGVDPRRVAIGHCDTVIAPGYHEALLDRGAWVQLDTIRGVSEFETQRQVELVRTLVERGALHRLLLSHDIASDRLLTAHGGQGYAYLITGFCERLRAAGLSEEQIDLLVRDNPRRMLTGEDDPR